MQTAYVVTGGSLTLAGAVLSGWLWLDSVFASDTDVRREHKALQEQIDEIKEDHKSLRSELISRIGQMYLELKIDGANSELRFYDELDELSASEQRHYDLLKYQVEQMTLQLEELRR